jgi:flagellar basal body-associated protein FliL
MYLHERAKKVFETLMIIGLVVLLVIATSAALIMRRYCLSSILLSIEEEIEQAVDRLGEAAKQHAEVIAIMALTENLDSGQLNKLAEYSNHVVISALMFRVNSLGSDIETVQTALSRSRLMVATGYPSQKASVEAHEQTLDELFGKLERANDAVEVMCLAVS